MKVLKKILILALAVASIFTLAACANNQNDDNDTAETKTTLRIGTVAHARIATEAGVAALEEMGYEVEVVMFDDFITPDSALAEGSVDANLYQHQTFLNSYNEEHDTDLVMLEKIVYPFAGIYSTNYASLDDLKANGAGGKIAVASDASNQSLDLQNIAAAGLITLTDESKDLYSIADIVDNPYNFEFVYMDRNVIYNSRDEFAAYIGTIEDSQTRMIFRLRYIHGMAWKEVAAAVGGRNTENSVKSVCYRYIARGGPARMGRPRKAEVPV